MYKILCITNSSICEFDFLSHIETLAKSDVYAIILREKQLSCDSYCNLAEKVISICKKHNKICILHNFIDVALYLKHYAIHLPLPVLENSAHKTKNFKIIGSSTHNLEQAKKSEILGATYITYGHIFSTDCKKGLPPKGVNSINEIIQSIDIPVYPLGGINNKNFQQVVNQNVNGFAVMSQLMKKNYNDILNLI